MPYVDHRAAQRIAEMREELGLSQEGLANAIKRKAQGERWFKIHGAVDAFTIRRIEVDGHCPSERVRLVVALFFGVKVREIWEPGNRESVDAETRERVRS